MIVLGIDPGQAGGLALVQSIGGLVYVLDAIPMPVITVGKKKSLDIRAALYWTGKYEESDVGVIEQVHAMPKQGVASSFQFGRMYGGAEAVMYEASVRQAYVTPNQWKKDLGLSSSKNASIGLATRLFGHEARQKFWPSGPRGGEINDGAAEAALIALWWLRKFG